MAEMRSSAFSKNEVNSSAFENQNGTTNSSSSGKLPFPYDASFYQRFGEVQFQQPSEMVNQGNPVMNPFNIWPQFSSSNDNYNGYNPYNYLNPGTMGISHSTSFDTIMGMMDNNKANNSFMHNSSSIHPLVVQQLQQVYSSQSSDSSLSQTQMGNIPIMASSHVTPPTYNNVTLPSYESKVSIEDSSKGHFDASSVIEILKNDVQLREIEKGIRVREEFLKSHPHLRALNTLMLYCKNDGMMLFGSSSDPDVRSKMVENDFSLNPFLQAQAIEGNGLMDLSSFDEQERTTFTTKLEEIKKKYYLELERITGIYNEIRSKTLEVMKEQASTRTVLESESELRLLAIKVRFDFIRNQLRQNVYTWILTLAKQYHQIRPKKRTLPKKASEVLADWFHEHINDPYPSEEEKTMMAANVGITMTQLNNWFGNKRIRYKRKCLENEKKRGEPLTAEEIREFCRE